MINFCFTSLSFRAACNFLFSFSILMASSKHSIILVRINYNFMKKMIKIGSFLCILETVLKMLAKIFNPKQKGLHRWIRIYFFSKSIGNFIISFMRIFKKRIGCRGTCTAVKRLGSFSSHRINNKRFGQ